MELEAKHRHGAKAGDWPDTAGDTAADAGRKAARRDVASPGEKPDAGALPVMRADEAPGDDSDHTRQAGTAIADEEAGKKRGGLLHSSSRLFRLVFFSSLTRRIVFLNLTALAVLLSGILYLNQFREGLIDARMESLLIQGRIIAGAIAASASVETDTITIDPDKLLELQAGESVSPTPDTLETLDSPLQPQRIAPILRSLVQPTRTRARIYDPDAVLILDSRFLYGGGQVLRYDLQPLAQDEEGMIARIGKMLNRLLQRRDLPIYRELAGLGSGYPEVMSALTGSPATSQRMTEDGALIVSVAVPVQRFRAILGVLLLSTQGDDIDRIVAEERIAIMRLFLIAGVVIIVLSILLASTIANPLRKLSDAAVRVRQGVKTRAEIPDMSSRGDEIGNLSQSLREMTNALYARIEAIERFAADVSHELKNPLTSLRSAVETLPLARNETSRQRLMDVIQHDVVRLDRLITDISDASRLDAELAREDANPIDLNQFLERITSMQDVIDPDGKHVEIVYDPPAETGRRKTTQAVEVMGYDIRIGQVMSNLIANARSFVPAEGGRIDVRLARKGKHAEIIVEDNGRGIEPDAIERIFERFYTDRPAEEGFGQNSGLGLSISRQIVEAHGGSLIAENRPAPEHGARFIIRLPLIPA